jgi:hypothetical protein
MDAHDVAERWKAGGGVDETALADPALRRAVYVIAADDPHPYHGLLRAMLATEAVYRAAESTPDDGEHFENIYFCGLLLYEIGDVRDAPALWAAKETDFDTHCGFDVQMLVGAGTDETIDYLRKRGGREDIAAADYIAQCQATGDFDDLTGWRKFARQYHLGEPSS